MHSDDLNVAYADSFPATLTDFRREVAQGEKLLLLGFVDGHVAGAIWLHDLLHRRDGTVSAGWLGCSFLASYRVNLVTQVLFYGALATAGCSFAPSPLPKEDRRSKTPPEVPRSLASLEARGALFDEGPDTFPGVLRFTADVLREGFKFQGSAQIDVLIVIQGTLGQA
jgi:hypothetical protein